MHYLLILKPLLFSNLIEYCLNPLKIYFLGTNGSIIYDIELLLFLRELSDIVSHGVDPLGLRFQAYISGLHFRSYKKLACPTLIFSLQMVYR